LKVLTEILGMNLKFKLINKHLFRWITVMNFVFTLSFFLSLIFWRFDYRNWEDFDFLGDLSRKIASRNDSRQALLIDHVNYIFKTVRPTWDHNFKVYPPGYWHQFSLSKVIRTGLGNCGISSMALIALLNVNKFDARYISVGNDTLQHNVVEVKLENRWVLVDPQTGWYFVDDADRITETFNSKINSRTPPSTASILQNVLDGTFKKYDHPSSIWDTILFYSSGIFPGTLLNVVANQPKNFLFALSCCFIFFLSDWQIKIRKRKIS